MGSLSKILNQETIDCRILHDQLKIETKYSMWVGRLVQKYGFEHGLDFCTILGKSNGGRPKKEYHITIDMAKQICMLDKSKTGMKVRKSYLELEKRVRRQEAIREAGKLSRRTATDAIQESGENERMHGRGYSNYTRLVYKLAGVEYEKIDNFRDTLPSEDLKTIENIELMVKTLLDTGKQYAEIKDIIGTIFTNKKEIEG